MFKVLPFLQGLLLLCSIAAYSQTREVTGRVTSADDGAGLPGVNVIVKSTTAGTVTDSNGRYTISVPSNDAVLIFSFIGFRTLEMPAAGRTTIDVELTSDAEQLGEVVVVGYGTQLKQEITGNIASVSGAAIQNLPVNTMEQALQGRAAGVFISANNGKLGQGVTVRVRGSSSLSASNEPLYVIDGMIINNDNLSGNTAVTNPLADINFNDIESIEILKDASASAIYGARASNGVVLITTKQGKAGKTNFTLGMQYGSSKPTNHRKFLNAQQYIELYREAAVNRDLALGYDPINNPDDYPGSFLEEIEGTFDLLAGDTDWRKLENSTDWEREAYQKAGLFNFDLSANGGSDKTRFYFNGSYSDQDGILIGNSFKRFSGRLNLDHKVNDRLNFGVKLNVAQTTNNRVADDRQFYTPMQLVAQSPLTPVRDKQGVLFDDSQNKAMLYYPATVELENSHFITRVNRNITAITAQYNILKDLSFRAEYGFDLLTQNEDRHQNKNTEDGRDVGGYGRMRWAQIFNSTYRGYFNWLKNIDSHSFDFTLGTDYQTITTRSTRAEAQGFPTVTNTTLESAANPVVSTAALTETLFSSYYLRLNYKFKNRYLLSVSTRYDGSSQFADGERYGVFPAASVGWIVSEEGFLAGSNTVSFLKLRASYGLTGNANFAAYRFLGVFAPGAYGGDPTLSASRLENPELRWEKTLQTDVGVDFGFLNDKITGQFDVYEKNTSDLLLDRTITGVTGYSSMFANIGKLQNRGYEIVLNYVAVKNSDLKVDVGLNYSRNDNKIVSLDLNQDVIENPSPGRFLNVVKVGEPMGVFYGPQYAGVDPENGNALWYVNGETPGEKTNVYGDAKKVVLGNPTPNRIYGFTLNAAYKGFDLAVLFQGVAGNQIFNAAGAFMSANGRYEDNQTVDQLRRWQKPGDITDVPQARLYRANGTQVSSRYLMDGDYLRLRTLTVGYSLPKAIVSRASFTSARIYFTAQNLLTFTKYDGWDPEVNTDYTSGTPFLLGNDFYSAPQPKTFIAGIRLGF